MPHLSAMQAKYADDGVTIIGVSKEDPSNSLDKVKAMVKAKGDGMAYSVAWDDAGRTYEAYMKASGQRGIPTAFLIDKQGRIAFIGHPMEMDAPLAELVAGTWSPAKAQKIAASKARRAALSREINSFYGAAANSVEGDAAQELLAKWKAFSNKHPDVAGDLQQVEYRLLSACGQQAKARVIGRQLVEAAVQAKNAMALNGVAWDIVDPERQLKQRDLMLALYAATHASRLKQHKEPAILDTLARAHFLMGNLSRAIELQEKALSLAPDPMKKDLEKTLSEYRQAK